MRFLKLVVTRTNIRKYSSDAMTRAWTSNRIIPDVIQKVPGHELKVEYDGVALSHGNAVKPTQARLPPNVSWTSKPGLFYTLAMVDPDAPSRDKPSLREWQHWLVVNIPDTRVDQGEVLSQYIGAGPPLNTGKHRYVFLLYEQPKKIHYENEPKLTNTSVKGRPKFCINKFAERHSLGQPIAGNFFLAEWDDYVPQLYKQIGL